MDDYSCDGMWRNKVKLLRGISDFFRRRGFVELLHSNLSSESSDLFVDITDVERRHLSVRAIVLTERLHALSPRESGLLLLMRV